MILLVDIGNTRCKYAMLYPDRLIPGGGVDNCEGIASLFTKLPEVPTEVYVSCVGAEHVLAQLVDWSQEHWGCTPIRLVTQVKACGVANGYRKPHKLGVDRWLAMIGAYRLVQGAVLVIDCGTVCTADLLDRDGKHLGGAMMPGARLMNHALQSGTEAISTEAEVTSQASWGDSTAGSIAYGIRSALVGFIEQTAVKAAEELNGAVTLVLTGGDAPLLLKELKMSARYEKELVFHGMAVMLLEKG